ncbi:MAG: hypothetical protein NTZ42_04540 [Candidatus Gribaldobacteria bacterium]|nr:hypothetical protein [Candidatus Gribaldobacteria bacterium]
MVNKNSIFVSLIVLLIIVCGFFAYQYWQKIQINENQTQEQSPVVNNQINNQNQAQNQAQVVSNETAIWKIYTSEKYNFEVKYPSDWAINPDRFGQSSVVFEAPQSQDAKNLEAELERISNSGDEKAMLDFVEKNKDLLNKGLIDQRFFKVTVMDNPQEVYTYESFNKNVKQGVKIEKIMIGGYEGVEYTLGDNDPAPQAIVIKDNRAYLIDGVDIANVFDSVLSTFRFLK